jgi:hypothetical protein
LVILGFELRALLLNHASNPFLLIYAQASLDRDLSTYVSCIHVMTGVYHQAQLLLVEMESPQFCPG